MLDCQVPSHTMKNVTQTKSIPTLRSVRKLPRVTVKRAVHRVLAPVASSLFTREQEEYSPVDMLRDMFGDRDVNHLPGERFRIEMA